MPEQTTDTGHVDQMDAAENYLQSYSLVDDNGSEDVSSNYDTDDGETIEKEPKQTQETGNDEVSRVVNEESKEAIALKEAPKPTQSIKSLTKIPEGFMGSFYSKNDEGKIELKRDEAMKFLLPENGKSRFEYSPDRRKIVDDPNEPKEPKDSYTKMVEENKSYREGVRKNMNLGLDTLEKVFRENGGDIDKAYAAARQEVNQLIQADFEEKDLENQVNFQKSLEEKFGTKQNSERVQEQARSNESLLMNELASNFDLSPDQARDKYVQLMKNGLPIINRLFDMAHPEYLEGKTKSEFNNAWRNWWQKVAADNDTLRFVYGLILNDVNVQLQPFMNEGYQARKKGLSKQNKRAAARRPSNRSREAPQENVSDRVKHTEQYFGVTQADRV